MGTFRGGAPSFARRLPKKHDHVPDMEFHGGDILPNRVTCHGCGQAWVLQSSADSQGKPTNRWVPVYGDEW